MATKVFSFDTDAGADIYVRIFGRTGSEVGQVYDANDDTFKALGSATTPYITCTEQTAEDGTAFSSYTVAIDMADINSTLALKDYVLRAYDNATPADTDVAVSAALAFSVQAAEEGRQEITVSVEGCNTSSAGTQVNYLIRLYVNGTMRVLDNAATCVLTVREQGAGSDLFTSGSINPEAGLGYFEHDESTPGFTDDRLYEHEVLITEDSVAVTRLVDWQVFG